MNPKNWYRDCGDAIRKEFGKDADLFIDILASTSPRKQIKANWRLAMRIYHVYKTSSSIIFGFNPPDESEANLYAGTLPCHRGNIKRAILGEPLSGNKVKAFAANLKGDLEQVTIDMWVQKYFGSEGTLTTKKYNQFADIIRKTARGINYKPAEWQAVIWCLMRKQVGKEPRSFLTMMNQGQQYFEFYCQ